MHRLGKFVLCAHDYVDLLFYDIYIFLIYGFIVFFWVREFSVLVFMFAVTYL